MNYQKLVKEQFDQTVRAAAVPNELKYAMKKHEMTQRFINNLIVEMKKTQEYRAKKGRPPATDHQLRWAVDEMTKFMLQCAVKAADLNTMSTAERRRYEDATQKVKDMDSTLEGKPAGIYEEMGVYDVEKLEETNLSPDIKKQAYAQVRKDSSDV